MPLVLLSDYTIQDEILYQKESVNLVLSNNLHKLLNLGGDGTLSITVDSVIWINSENKGIMIDFPSIVLHALCREKSDQPSVYCQIQAHKVSDVDGTDLFDVEPEEGEEHFQQDEECSVVVLSFYSPDIDEIFVKFSEGAARNPVESEEGDNSFFDTSSMITAQNVEEFENIIKSMRFSNAENEDPQK